MLESGGSCKLYVLNLYRYIYIYLCRYINFLPSLLPPVPPYAQSIVLICVSADRFL